MTLLRWLGSWFALEADSSLAIKRWHDDGSPRPRITEDKATRLTLVKGLNAGAQRVIKAEHE